MCLIKLSRSLYYSLYNGSQYFFFVVLHSFNLLLTIIENDCQIFGKNMNMYAYVLNGIYARK